MKKHLTGITALAMALTLSACAQQKKATTTTDISNSNTEATGKVKTVSTDKPLPVSDATRTSATSNYSGEIKSVSMTRTPCFGRCPAYTLELFSNGLARYTSQIFTEFEGVYEKNIDAKKAASLFAKYKSNHVDTCSQTYEAYIADIPGIVYKINWSNGGEQSIYNAHFGPDYLATLAKEMDEIAKIDKTWKKTGDVKKP